MKYAHSYIQNTFLQVVSMRTVFLMKHENMSQEISCRFIFKGFPFAITRAAACDSKKR